MVRFAESGIIMEAEQLNQMQASVVDLGRRALELRGYL
jgi:hypothetical protein